MNERKGADRNAAGRGPGSPLTENPAESRASQAEDHEVPEPGEHAGPHEHEPSTNSVWPVALAFGLLVAFFGVLNSPALTIVGLVIVGFAIVAWLWQPWVT